MILTEPSKLKAITRKAKQCQYFMGSQVLISWFKNHIINSIDEGLITSAEVFISNGKFIYAQSNPLNENKSIIIWRF